MSNMRNASLSCTIRKQLSPYFLTNYNLFRLFTADPNIHIFIKFVFLFIVRSTSPFPHVFHLEL